MNMDSQADYLGVCGLEPGAEIVLALGGGAARGVAHIGVIRTLEEAGFRIRGVAGTSIGAVIGGMYCAGELEPFSDFLGTVDRRSVFRFLDPILPRAGLFAGMRLEGMLSGFVGARQIADLPIPFVAVAVDVAGGDEVRLRDCALVDGIRASFGIPGLFAPKRLVVNGVERWLVDGGVASPVPVGAAKELADLPVVAVNVNKGFERPQVLRKRNGQGKSESRMENFLGDERVPKAARE
ncbi:MAG: NTE family protein, partial [Gammaproteobacteria bacterium]